MSNVRPTRRKLVSASGYRVQHAAEGIYFTMIYGQPYRSAFYIAVDLKFPHQTALSQARRYPINCPKLSRKLADSTIETELNLSRDFLC